MSSAPKVTSLSGLQLAGTDCIYNPWDFDLTAFTWKLFICHRFQQDLGNEACLRFDLVGGRCQAIS
jgi:hypothetical protein